MSPNEPIYGLTVRPDPPVALFPNSYKMRDIFPSWLTPWVVSDCLPVCMPVYMPVLWLYGYQAACLPVCLHAFSQLQMQKYLNMLCRFSSKSFINISMVFFFNWDSLHARLNSHYQAWSYKKGSTKKITRYRKSV